MEVTLDFEATMSELRIFDIGFDSSCVESQKAYTAVRAEVVASGALVLYGENDVLSQMQKQLKELLKQHKKEAFFLLRRG